MFLPILQLDQLQTQRTLSLQGECATPGPLALPFLGVNVAGRQQNPEDEMRDSLPLTQLERKQPEHPLLLGRRRWPTMKRD